MPAATLDLFMEQGASFKRTLIFKDSQVVPVEIDLTGNVYKAEIRKTISGDLVAEFVCTVLDQVTNKGEMTMYLSDEQTEAIVMKPQNTQTRALEKFTYDMEVEYPSGDKDRVIQGVISISPGVTHD